MAKLTVILIRSGETEAEAFDARGGTNREEDDLVECNDDDDSHSDDHHSSSHNETTSSSNNTNSNTRRLRLSQRIDPTLTERGFLQAQDCLTGILKGLSDSTENERRLSAITAPTKACTGTTLMLTCAGSYDNIRWQLTTVESLQAPCAVPVLVHNSLCTAEGVVERCGGHVPVVDAGLLHCAAAPWNDARQKCPFSKVLKQFKRVTKEQVREWKEHHTDRRCIAVQYLRMQDAKDPWSLHEMTLKNNILVDLIDPRKYMTPPRKGQLEKKRVGMKRPDRPKAEEGVRQAVLWSRQVGCDAVILVLGRAAMQELACTAGLLQEGEQMDAPACSVASLVANVPDDTEASLNDIEFDFHGFFTAVEVMENPAGVIPEYAGPVDTIVQPPEGKDPTTVPVNQWSKFPPPQPENIPDDYPDLPPFSQCLDNDIPKRPVSGPPKIVPPEQARLDPVAE